MKILFLSILMCLIVACNGSDDSTTPDPAVQGPSSNQITTIEVNNIMSDLSYTDYRFELNGNSHTPADQFDRSHIILLTTPQVNIKIISTSDNSIIFEKNLTVELGKGHHFVIGNTSINPTEISIIDDFPARGINPQARIINMLDSTTIDAYATPFNTDCSTITGSEPMPFSGLSSLNMTDFFEVDPSLNMLCFTNTGLLTNINSISIAHFGDTNAIWTYIIYQDASGFPSAFGYSDPIAD